jgi:uncharacterized membrane protein YbhN (UPF0104 family)
MRKGFRRWWPALKLLLGLALVLLIARQFVRDLDRPELRQQTIHLGWLVLAGVLFLAGMGCSALYWRRLLGHLGAHPPLGTSLRAYFLGQLGKYVPGKAWALALRAGIIHGAGVRLAVAVLTTFYEVLTTMAAGVLVAGVLYTVLGTGRGGADDFSRLWRTLWQQPQDATLGRGQAVLLAVALLALTALPLQPAFFNRLARRLLLPFRQSTAHIPQVRFAYFAEGLAFAAVGWLLLGASLAAALSGTTGRTDFWAPAMLGRVTAAMGLSYVIGFVVFVTPGGLGVREFFLMLLLTPLLADLPGGDPAHARAATVLAVLLLRLTTVVAEALVGAALVAGGFAGAKRRGVPVPNGSPAEASAPGGVPGGRP